MGHLCPFRLDAQDEVIEKGATPANDVVTSRSVLDPYRDSAALVEASDPDYTILRPGWFTHDQAIDYQITQKGEAFKGHDVSVNSLSDLIAKLATSPALAMCAAASA